MTNNDTTYRNGFAVLEPGQGSDGGPRDVDKDELTKFKDELSHIARSAGYNINERRAAAEEVRFNLWLGQSMDGRKHADAQDGKPAFPFEGASDGRHRLADMIINERVMILAAAAIRNRPEVVGLDIDNMALGHKLSTILRWVIANKLGADYVIEILKLASYQEADSPAASIAGVWWDQEPALAMKTITLEELGQLLVQTYGMAPEQVAELEGQLHDETKDKDTAEALQQVVDHLTPTRAKQMVRDLRTDGKAAYPCPYLRRDQPTLLAYRLMEDVFVPTNTPKAQRARCWYLREWLNEVELRQRIVTHRYTEEFVDEAVKHEGMSGFPIYRRGPAGETLQPYLVQETADDRRGLHEIWTVLFQAVNDDNINAIYYLTFHDMVDIPAHERRLFDYDHGEYPFTWFGREYITPRLMDSRGIAELAATEQFNQKLLSDAYNDHVSLTTVPPIRVPKKRISTKFVIGPMRKIPEDRPGEISYLERTQSPVDNRTAYEASRMRVNEYFGRICAEVPPTLSQLHMQHMTSVFLANLSGALSQVLQLCQQFLSDADLQLICGDDGVPIARSREEIQGKFRVELSFDARHLDMEYIKTLAEIIQTFLVPLDNNNVIIRQQLLQILFNAINPGLAKKVIAPDSTATAKDTETAKTNMAMIQTGVEPAMVPEGQNYQQQLTTILDNAEMNPEYIPKLTPVSRQMFIAHIEYLFNQVQQQWNAQIGRQVGDPVMGNPQLMQLEQRVKRAIAVAGGKGNNQ